MAAHGGAGPLHPGLVLRHRENPGQVTSSATAGPTCPGPVRGRAGSPRAGSGRQMPWVITPSATSPATSVIQRPTAARKTRGGPNRGARARTPASSGCGCRTRPRSRAAPGRSTRPRWPAARARTRASAPPGATTRAEAPLDVAPDLRPQPEHDAPARELLELVGRVRQAHRVAGEGDGDARSPSTPASSARPPTSSDRNGLLIVSEAQTQSSPASSAAGTRAATRGEVGADAGVDLHQPFAPPLAHFSSPVGGPAPARRRPLDRRGVDREPERDPHLDERPAAGWRTLQQLPGRDLLVVGHGAGCTLGAAGTPSARRRRERLLHRQRPDRSARSSTSALDPYPTPSASHNGERFASVTRTP